MVIQRWQSVLLLLAFNLLGLAFIMPVGTVDGVDIEPTSDLPFMIINITAAILAAIDIFLYRNLPLQIRIASVTMVLAIGAAIVGALHFMVTDGFGMVVVGGFPLPLIAAIFIWIARSMMVNDRRLLAAADRIR
ncbi:MAG: DUF4293 domain-containing protein [Muribaculaceae bacterium]|jgi:hypothetical protein